MLEWFKSLMRIGAMARFEKQLVAADDLVLGLLVRYYNEMQKVLVQLSKAHGSASKASKASYAEALGFYKHEAERTQLYIEDWLVARKGVKLTDAEKERRKLLRRPHASG
jgi:hypothetical protein